MGAGEGDEPRCILLYVNVCPLPPRCDVILIMCCLYLYLCVRLVSSDEVPCTVDKYEDDRARRILLR